MSDVNINSPRLAVLVMGMHRSGTSALAGVLNILGCDEPATLMGADGGNEKGYFESDKLHKIHNRLLASAATDWDDWQPVPQAWFASPRAEEFRELAAQTMMVEFGNSRLFVLKDPRICRLVPFWEQVLADLGAEPRYVHTHRNPLEVEYSLRKRDLIPSGLGLLIWLRHVLDAEAGTRGRARTFISYAQLLNSWTKVAERIQADLEFRFPCYSVTAAAKVDAFLESTLRHNVVAPDSVLRNAFMPDWIRGTFETLERWAETGEDRADYVHLDQIRALLDASAPPFAPVIISAREQIETLRSAQAAAADAAQFGLGEREAELAKSREDYATLQTEMIALREQAAAADAARVGLDEREAELAKSREDYATLQTEMIALREQAAAADAAQVALGEREAELAKSCEDYATLQTEMIALRARLNEQREENCALLESQDRDAAVLRDTQDQWRREIGALRNSRSWRVTRPLRAVTTLLSGRSAR